MIFQKLLRSVAPRSVILIRFIAGGVFLSEGIQKFLYPTDYAAGRFAKIGIPAPELLGPFVGGVELICGALLLAGLFTRLAAIPLVITMIVAIITTKLPILLGHNLGPFHLTFDLERYGFWAMLHETRTDWSMLLSSLFLAVVGAGPWSLDCLLLSWRSAEKFDNQ